MMPAIHRHPHARAFALISTLLVLTILTVMVVVFLQSMRTDRLTSRAYLNKLKADAMAEAAQQSAISKILQAVPTGTNAAKGFVTWGYSNNNDFRPFYVAISQDVLNGDFTNTSGTAPNTYWLVSSSSNSLPANLGPNEIMALSSTASVDMNANKQIDPGGGSYPAGWIYLGSNAPNTSGTYGRYAYWVDDESSKLDVSRVGNVSGTITTSTTYTPTVAQPNDPNAPLDATNLKIEGLSTEDVKTLVTYRSSTIWPSPSSPAQTVAALSGGTNQNLYTVDVTREETVQSTGTYPDPQNLIAYGPKVGEARMNVNVVATTPATLADAATTAVPSISQFIQNGLPDFYNRKETTIGAASGGVPGTTNRLAASIVNYIRSERYPMLSPSLQTYFNNIQTMGSTIWGNYSNPNLWYGIAATPRVNEILYYFGTASSASPQYLVTNVGGANPYKTQVGLTRIIELWNSADTPSTVPNLYIHFIAQQHSTVSGVPLNGYVPQLSSEDIAISSTPITLSPNEFRAFSLSRVYTVYSSQNTSFNAANQSGSGTAMGFILFYIEGAAPTIITNDDGSTTIQSMNGTPRILDAYWPCNLGGSYSTGKSGCSPGYGSSGNSEDLRETLGRYLSSWATMAKERHTPGVPNNTTGGSGGSPYQDMTTWFDRPLVGAGGGYVKSPYSAPTHIAHAPMQNIVELGNIFDPTFDTVTGDSRPRGTKTLVIGQFDSFVRSNYTNYLKKADAALLEIFTIDNNNDRLRLNVNVPRPGTLTDTTYSSLNPLQTFWSYLRNQFLQFYPVAYASTPPAGQPVLTGSKLKMTDNPINPEIAKRLVAGAWTDAKPFRNFNDFILLGYTPSQLNSSVLIDNPSPSIWGKTGSLYNNVSGLANVSLAGGTGAAVTQRLDGNDRVREEAFGRVAHLITFRSYRYRIYSQGQALDQNGRVLARTAKNCIVDLIPNVQVSGSSGTPTSPNQITYSIKITSQP
ncbi:MAG: hypothetical protein LBH01_11660 [Verrucomicrobiales bacterium]|jgi:Tfp pilus assembly protein PilX|nr:hypothetical protein [Verrucomicrobiales bacterium]